MRKFLGIQHNGKGYCGTFNTANDFVLENGPEVIRSTQLTPAERVKIQKQYVDRQVEKLPHIPLKTSQFVSWHMKQRSSSKKVQWSVVAVAIGAASIGGLLYWLL